MIDWSRVIATGVGPIIVISACGLLCLAFYNRLAMVVTRLRSFQRERLHEQEALVRAQKSEPRDELAVIRHQELLGMLQVQTERVVKRARLIRSCLSCLLVTIMLLAACSLLLGLSVIWPFLMYVAALLFIAGLLMLMIGVLFAVAEIRNALDPIELETKFVTTLMADLERSE